MGECRAWQPNVQKPTKRSGRPISWRRSQSVVLSRKQAKEKHARTPAEPLNSTANLAPRNLGQEPTLIPVFLSSGGASLQHRTSVANPVRCWVYPTLDRGNNLGTISVPMCSKSLLIIPTGARTTPRKIQTTASACEAEANKTYRRFFRQLTFPAVTVSDLQRREAPLSTCNHC